MAKKEFVIAKVVKTKEGSRFIQEFSGCYTHKEARKIIKRLQTKWKREFKVTKIPYRIVNKKHYLLLKNGR